MSERNHSFSIRGHKWFFVIPTITDSSDIDGPPVHDTPFKLIHESSRKKTYQKSIRPLVYLTLSLSGLILPQGLASLMPLEFAIVIEVYDYTG